MPCAILYLYNNGAYLSAPFFVQRSMSFRMEQLLDAVAQLKRERAVYCERAEVLTCASTCTALQRQQAADILHAQWGGSVPRRLRSLDASAHLWIARGTGRCVGHARLVAAAATDRDDAAGGRCAIATSVVVERARRGAGRGTRMMQALEAFARRAGFTYVYLWTDDAVRFYARLGYLETEGASADAAALRKLPRRSLSALEGLFAGRADAASAASAATAGQQQGECERLEQTVHMRKRLVEELPLRAAPSTAALLGALRRTAGRAVDGRRAGGVWSARIARVAIAAQVGPTCGLAALRMARSHATARGECTAGGAGAAACQGALSLLAVARARGYSVDGEVFDVGHLCDLARGVCGLDAAVVAWPAPRQLVAAFEAGHVFVVPYDRGEAEHGAPACRGGTRAHYALLVGCASRCSSDSDGGGSGGSSSSSSSSTDEGSPTAPLMVLSTAPLASEGTITDADIIIVGQHGMSSHPVAATFDAWRTSNAQLTAVRGGFLKHGRISAGGPHLAGSCILVRCLQV